MKKDPKRDPNLENDPLDDRSTLIQRTLPGTLI